mgnify:CR=1 FL=1
MAVYYLNLSRSKHPVHTASLLQVNQDPKLDKGDQHDSGIDVSDHPNSGGSSTRSSPSTESKVVAPKLEKVKNDAKKLIPFFTGHEIVKKSSHPVQQVVWWNKKNTLQFKVHPAS